MRYEISKYERLRILRDNCGLTQKAVAQELNIGQNTLSQYEAGSRNIPNEILIQLALLYDSSTDYILGLTDIQKPYPRRDSK